MSVRESKLRGFLTSPPSTAARTPSACCHNRATTLCNLASAPEPLTKTAGPTSAASRESSIKLYGVGLSPSAPPRNSTSWISTDPNTSRNLCRAGHSMTGVDVAEACGRKVMLLAVSWTPPQLGNNTTRSTVSTREDESIAWGTQPLFGEKIAIAKKARRMRTHAKHATLHAGCGAR
eukprot:1276517-Rhodomonas_salina.2